MKSCVHAWQDPIFFSFICLEKGLFTITVAYSNIALKLIVLIQLVETTQILGCLHVIQMTHIFG